ncbi:AraC family transcriptional regulator [Streptomyces bathyalis]|uniref:AraC family transcriptional regulator n=1 Tax=Streptomyces bathyalis TaxID=2710756 RepID=A0A7T1T2X4_9ACTN|nr:AraC family transcriptional regulator [Streptomyces bathyalis]
MFERTRGTYVVNSSSIRDVGPRERADFWTDHVSSVHCRMDLRFPHGDSFRAGTIRQQTDTYQLAKCWSDKLGYLRTPQQVRQHPDEDYRFVIMLSGRAVHRQDGEEAEMVPGTAGLIPVNGSYQTLYDRYEGLSMTIPAHEVDSRLNRKSPVTAGLDLGSGLGRVVGDMVTSLHEARDTLTTSQFDAVSDRIVELLCMLVAGDDRPDAPEHLAEVEAVVRRHVREHAGDPGLNGEAMARALGWSLRQIQLALQCAGTTPRELIREERLRLIRERLQNPAYQHVTITDLAYASGFSSPSALSTAFRKRFGISPREMRHEGDAGTADAQRPHG